MLNSILDSIPYAVPVLAGLAMWLASRQGNRASMVGAAAVLALSSTVAAVVAFEIRPLFTFWEEGGYAVMPPYLISLYGIGCASAWSVSKAPGSLRGALGCLVASPIASVVIFQGVMRDIAKVIEHAAAEDRSILLMGCLGEAARIVEVGGFFTVITSLILIASTHRSSPSVTAPTH